MEEDVGGEWGDGEGSRWRGEVGRYEMDRSWQGWGDECGVGEEGEM